MRSYLPFIFTYNFNDMKITNLKQFIYTYRHTQTNKQMNIHKRNAKIQVENIDTSSLFDSIAEYI